MSRSLDEIACEIAGLKPDPKILPGLAARLGLDADAMRARAYERFGQFTTGGFYERGRSDRVVEARWADREAFTRAQSAYVQALAALQREVHG